jgi:Holliday junction resolvase RusA-like endonuclease
MTDEPQMVHRGHALVDDAEFWEAVDAEHPDFARIKQMVAGAYQAETGKGDPTERELSSWLTMALVSNPGLREGISTPRTPKRQIILPNLAVKFDYILRRPCFICLPYQKTNYISFSLPTEPVSRQADRHMAFKDAVKDYLRRANHDFTDFYYERLCVAVLFAMRAGSPDTDVDNMAKTVLDALQKYAYDDDKQIDHLDAIRLNSGSDDETFIGLRIAVTGIASDEDVIWPAFDVTHIKTPGVGPIDLTPYRGGNPPATAGG